MKIAIFTAALALVASSAFAADLSTVGTDTTEIVTDYTYLRSINTPYYLAAHQADVGVQVNKGALGSVTLTAGDSQLVTDYRLNFPTFTAGYSNGVKIGNLLGGVGLVGNVNYTTFTGDRWFFSGRNSSIPSHLVSGTAELNAPVGFVFTHYLINVRPFVDYTYDHGYNRYGDANDATATAGLYAVPTTFAPHLITKIGYERTVMHQNAQGVVASINYRF